MRIKLFLLSLLALALSAAAAAGQSCPNVNVSSPDDAATGSAITYTANVSGGDSSVTPTFNWTVSAGIISSGQGTSSISVDSNGAVGSVTASVDVGGYDRSCSTFASSTTTLRKPGPPAVKVDELGSITGPSENARMDKMAVKLKADPSATMYIIYYDGRKHTPGDAEAASLKAYEYIKNSKGVPNDVLTGAGGYREKMTLEFFIGAAGATPPMATPTVRESDTQKLPAAPAKDTVKKPAGKTGAKTPKKKA